MARPMMQRRDNKLVFERKATFRAVMAAERSLKRRRAMANA